MLYSGVSLVVGGNNMYTVDTEPKDFGETGQAAGLLPYHELPQCIKTNLTSRLFTSGSSGATNEDPMIPLPVLYACGGAIALVVILALIVIIAFKCKRSGSDGKG